MPQKAFEILGKSKFNLARTGVLKTAHGSIRTPVFMPIATRGSVKALTADDLLRLKAEIILGNTYHLYLKPGLPIIKGSRGLHQFINWPKAILTDSGGFQVFSLETKKQKTAQLLVKVKDDGVEFRSVYDGSAHFFSPASVQKTQEVFSSDIAMVLDQCVANPSTYDEAEKAVKRTLDWSVKSLKYFKNSKKSSGRQLFAIVQGSLFRDLREKCAHELTAMDFSGFAIGGLAVGESPEEMYRVLDYTVPLLPEKKPRYLMGVGYPEQIVEAVKRGVDMFDCVIPTREARHGRLYFYTVRPKGIKLFNNLSYRTLNFTNSHLAFDHSSINPKSSLPELRQYSKAYLRHLFMVNEPLALRLATLNNLEFYLSLMDKIRTAIKKGNL